MHDLQQTPQRLEEWVCLDCRPSSTAATFDPEQRARMRILAQELATVKAEYANLLEEAQHFHPKAPFAGTWRDMNPELAPNDWVGQHESPGVPVKAGASEVSTYLDENTVQRIEMGESARFYPDGLEGPSVGLKVASIDRDASRVLLSGMWTFQHGGTVPPARSKACGMPSMRSIA